MSKTPDPTPTKDETFDQWFTRQKFKNFSASEFTSYFNVNRRGARNSAPPRKLWANIVPTLRVVDDLRSELGKSIVILSSYRSQAYNAAINGAATKSYHMSFMALDIAVSGYSPKQIHALLLAKRNKGLFKGGLGLYNTFVHIDTRGHNAGWNF
jgi:uncharacterized protein YcbK (DUF882 family)